MKISTNWLKDFVTLPPPVENIAERLTLAGLEVKKIETHGKDTIFEIEITSNRPDWLSHAGVAREIAAVQNLSFKPVDAGKPASRPMPSGWKLNVREGEGCPYYTAVYIEGVQAVPTPDFMKERLEACGVRSISFLVDVTNYVLLETGQPLHAFDADLLRGKEVQVRKAKPGEKMTMINGAALELGVNDLVIADSERAIALAGIMGGKDSEVNDRTRNIVLESAFFSPRWVRQSARRLGISSDSSYRFERRVDPEGVDLGRERAVNLIMQYAKPRHVSGIIKAGQPPRVPKERVIVSLHEVEKRLGAKLKSSQVMSVLTRLGLETKQEGSESFNAKVPSFRPDITQPVDLIEEIARIVGFENIPDTLPSRPPVNVSENPLWALEDRSRNFLSGTGLYETVTFSLVSTTGLDPEKDLKNAVSVHNPQNQDLTWMRPVLFPSLLAVVQKNIRLGAKRVPIFEIANTYHRDGKSTREIPTLGILLYGEWKQKNWQDASRAVSFYDLKGILLNYFEVAGITEVSFAALQKHFYTTGIAEEITVGGKVVGIAGEITPKIGKIWDLETPAYYAELNLPAVLAGKKMAVRPFKDMPKYPAIERDLAVVVSESVKAGEIEKEILKMGRGLIRKIELFDLFRGGRIPKGAKNIAFRVVYQSLEKTLVSDEIQKLHTEIGQTIAAKFQASFQ